MAKTKPAKAAVVEDDLDELEELEEIEEAPKKSKSTKAAPAKATKKARAAASEDEEESTSRGAAWLAEYINEETGKEYTGANIRVLLRKLARSGVLDREIGEDRSRYAFTGPNDPIVKAALKAVKEGDLEREKAERLQAVKDGKATKKAAKKAAPVEPDEDEDEDEIEEPAPKKKATRRR